METNSNISRRQFLQILAFGGVAGCVAGALGKFTTSNEILTETRVLMGTIINLTIVSDDLHQAQSAIDATFERMMTMETILSRHIPTSQLSQLNQDGYLLHAHPVLAHLVRQANILSGQTNGSFDISIKPLLDLYQQTASPDGALPSATAIAQAIGLVDYRKIAVEGRHIRLRTKGMAITLDGIAKGYIVDQGVEILRDMGFSNVLVEAGGDLLASGEKEFAQPWRVGMQAPRKTISKLLESFEVADQAVATSGDYMQFFSPDLLHHHIIDPRTGYSSPQLASVTVVAPTAMLADGLATALMVMEEKKGIDLIKRLPGCEAYLVTKDLEIIESANFPK